MHPTRRSCNVLVETALVISCLFLPRVYGLKCFECTLSENGCDSSLTTTTVTDCTRSLFTLRNDSGQPDYEYRCLKTIERTASELLYTRRCAYNYEANICNKTTGTVRDSRDLELVECSLCAEDYCNYAPDTLRLSSIYHYLFPCLMYFMTNR